MDPQPSFSLMDYILCMPSIELSDDTIDRLDALRVEDESYEEIINELINIYETQELTLFHGGDSLE